MPNVEDLTEEATTIINAASETVGHALVILTYYVLSNPTIYQTLGAELASAFPDPTQPLGYTALEKLPYLTATIKEGLRLSYGVPGRLPRMIETPTAEFNGYTVPRGTIVGMSSRLMHLDADTFSDPTAFRPERWLNTVEERKMERNLVPFSRGNRICIGMHLAYMELYVSMGTMFRKFDNLRLLEPIPEDSDFDDYFAAVFAKDRRKLLVTTIA